MTRSRWPSAYLSPTMSFMAADSQRWHMNACLDGRFGDADSLRTKYCDAYLDAAKLLVEAADSRSGYIDLLVYPTVYLYRHHFELLLKEVLAEAIQVAEMPARSLKGHRLVDFWRDVRRIVEEVIPEADWSQNDQVTRLLNELDQIDPWSDAFRYESSSTGNRNLPSIAHINIAVFSEAANALSEYLQEMLCGLGSVNPRRYYDQM